MSKTLYRKYRPQKFGDLVNQNHIKVTLQNEIETGKISHAYLFTGVRGIGKTTTARILAKAVNCQNRKNGQGEPCDSCDSCQSIINGKSLDIIEIDAASNTGVENVRENIINNVRVSPGQSKYKVFIIDEVHMLSDQAFNALLKTLEEPPEYAIFILATTEIHKVPATIISRCQRFDFKKIDIHELIERLRYICKQEEVDIDDKVLENIARYSEGCLRDAESILGQAFSLGDKKITVEQVELIIPRSDFNLVLELVEYLINKDAEKALVFINKLVEEGIDLQNFVNNLIEFLRKLLFYKISGRLNEFTVELDDRAEKKVVQLAKSVKTKELISMLELFIAKRQELKYAKIIQLPLELAVVEICDHKQGIDFDDSDNSSKLMGDDNKEDKDKFENNKKESDFSKEPAKSNTDKTNKAEEDKSAGQIKSENLKPDKKNSNLSIKQIEKKWLKVIKNVKQYNHSLATFLRTSLPFDMENNTLKIAFQYKFHKERVEDANNLEILYKVLEEVFGQKIVVKIVLDENARPLDLPEEKQENEKIINDVLKEFGGKLVD